MSAKVESLKHHRKPGRGRARLVDEIRIASGNELVTRERVDALEKWAKTFSGMTLWGRLRWLILGR
jgi:hypothetical protein